MLVTQMDNTPHEGKGVRVPATNTKRSFDDAASVIQNGCFGPKQALHAQVSRSLSTKVKMLDIPSDSGSRVVRMRGEKMRWAANRLATMAAMLSVSVAAIANDEEIDDTSLVLEEVVTTASKRSAAESVHDLAAAISVISDDSLAARQVIDLEDLSYVLPNVAFDGIGTGKGIANFSIRGAGVAGSIPSIDPTVGVFVDGMYLGVNYGVIMDMMDLEAVEVLRGPQGLLFGRNVIGGAVLLRSQRPSGERSAEATVRLETGLEKLVRFTVQESFLEGAVDARLAASYRNDAGWFDNKAPSGGEVGEETSWVLRPVLRFRPADDLDFTVIAERGKSDGDGPASQNRYQFRNFDFAIDEIGFSHVDWGHVVVEGNRHLAYGTVTNVLGVRSVLHASLADIDSTPDPVFHLWAYTDQEQVSNELRYSGELTSRWDVNAGIYAFRQEISYRERRAIRGAWGSPFGGDQNHRTFGVYFNNDVLIGEYWVASMGARYTVERKAVNVATASSTACSLVTSTCTYDFVDDDVWKNVTPRLALKRKIGPHTQAYGQWTRGFRSGGYNLRNTSPTGLPGPFDEEEQDAFEIGLKIEQAQYRFNLAAFQYRVSDLQRQVTRADPAQAAIQVTANTADATVYGVEAETEIAVHDDCKISAFVGVADGAYDRVRYDLDGDGSTVGDEKLELPRLAPLTFGTQGQCQRRVGQVGQLSVRIGIAHRDDSEIAHDNTGVLDGGNVLDASVSFALNDSWNFTLYGNNLLGEVFRRSHFDLTGLVTATYSPLKEGRAFGIEARWIQR